MKRTAKSDMLCLMKIEIVWWPVHMYFNTAVTLLSQSTYVQLLSLIFQDYRLSLQCTCVISGIQVYLYTVNANRCTMQTYEEESTLSNLLLHVD